MIARGKSRGMALGPDPELVALEIRADEEAATEILGMLMSDDLERLADPWSAPPPRANAAKAVSDR